MTRSDRCGPAYPITVRPMGPQDVPAVADIERACFGQSAWSAQSVRDELNVAGAVLLAAEANGSVIGYISMRAVLDEGYIGDLAVLPEARGHGAGAALLEALIARARALELSFITLEVRMSNAPALALYGRFGFADAGLRRGFYENPREDARLMTLYFDGQSPAG